MFYNIFPGETTIHRVGEVFNLSHQARLEFIMSGRIKARVHPIWFIKMMKSNLDPADTPSSAEREFGAFLLKFPFWLAQEWAESCIGPLKDMEGGRFLARLLLIREAADFTDKEFDIKDILPPITDEKRLDDLQLLILIGLQRSLLVDKKEAILALHAEGYRAIQEMPGISLQFVDSVINAKDGFLDELKRVSKPSGESEGAWEDSVTAICKAFIGIIKGGRTDWVNGREKGSNDTDSAGEETFRSFLTRMHPKGERCRVVAENAAWKVLVDNGYTHPGSRKQNA